MAKCFIVFDSNEEFGYQILGVANNMKGLEKWGIEYFGKRDWSKQEAKNLVHEIYEVGDPFIEIFTGTTDGPLTPGTDVYVSYLDGSEDPIGGVSADMDTAIYELLDYLGYEEDEDDYEEMVEELRNDEFGEGIIQQVRVY